MRSNQKVYRRVRKRWDDLGRDPIRTNRFLNHAFDLPPEKMRYPLHFIISKLTKSTVDLVESYDI